MQILMVLEREFPPDDRVEKEALSLAEAGHRVHIACYTKEQRSEFETRDGYNIYRKPISEFIYKSGAAILILPFYFRFWRRFINRLFQNTNYDAIHIHDLPLAKIGHEMKKKHNVSLICDQHEYYSDWIIHTAHYNTFIGRIIKALSRWKSYEERYLSLSDTVITVEPPLKEIYKERLNLPEDHIVLVPNTPRKAIFNKENIHANIVEMYKNRFVLLYIGGLDRLRGLDLVIRSVKILKEDIPGILMLLVGPKSKYFNFISEVQRNGIKDHFEWIPFQPVELLPSYIEAADICFFTPELNREEIHRTIATKIYQYVVMGKPVIVTRARMMQQFVESNGVGYTVDDSDPAEFIEKVKRIAGNPEIKERFEKNAVQASKQNYWEITVRPMLERYETLAKK